MVKIKKIFAAILLFLNFTIVNASAEVATQIDVVGNIRISAETIIVFGDISKGKDYNPLDINILIKKLYETSFFSNIKVNLKNGVLKITVVENPIVNSISFDGEKADKYKESITELLSLREKKREAESLLV